MKVNKLKLMKGTEMKLFKVFFAAMAVLATALPAASALAKDSVYTPRFSNLAVSGYDPVAYFNAGAPVKGSAEFEIEHEGATWRFSSAENRDLFVADPAAYAPQYGGYCAWAVAQGQTAKGDPNFWKVVDGKLYLNFNASVQKKWETDIPGFIEKADANWPGIL